MPRTRLVVLLPGTPGLARITVRLWAPITLRTAGLVRRRQMVQQTRALGPAIPIQVLEASTLVLRPTPVFADLTLRHRPVRGSAAGIRVPDLRRTRLR